MEENTVNPYQSPLASLTEGGMGEAGLEFSRPSCKLYTIGSIVLATFPGAIGGDQVRCKVSPPSVPFAEGVSAHCSSASHNP